MKPARFEYERPGSLGVALELLTEARARACPLAGGQSLVPLMNLRHVQPELIVDLNDLGEIGGVSSDGGELVIGALVRQRELERSPDVRRLCPLLTAAIAYAGTPQTRNRGTAGGSVSHADPSAELVTVLTACEATVTLTSTAGTRVLPAGEFFLSPFHTARQDDELVVEIRVAVSRGGWAFRELVSPARAPATVAVAMVSDEAGAITAAVSGVTPMPVRIHDVDTLPASGDPYRRAVAQELFRRCERDLGQRGSGADAR